MKKEFNKFLTKEAQRIKTKNANYDEWFFLLASIVGNFKNMAKRRGNGLNKTFKIEYYKNWNDFIVLAYRSLVGSHVSYYNRHNDTSFERTILIWHNRIRGKIYGRGGKITNNYKTKEEREWRFCLEKSHSKLLVRRDLIGWKKLIDYNYRYLLKSEKARYGERHPNNNKVITWDMRCEKSHSSLYRKKRRKNDGWIRLLESNLSYLIKREQIRQGVLAHG